MGSSIFLVAFANYQEVHTRGPAVASWEAQYSQYRDGSGKRVSRGGMYFANRDRHISTTTLVRGAVDAASLVILNAPIWNYHTYYLDPESVKVVEYDNPS